MKSNIYTSGCCEKCICKCGYDRILCIPPIHCKDKNCPNCHQNHKGKCCTFCQGNGVCGDPNCDCSPCEHHEKMWPHRPIAPTPHLQWEERFKDWFTQYRSDEDRDYYCLEEPIKQFISKLLQEERDKNYIDGQNDKENNEKFMYRGASQERARITLTICATSQDV